MSDLGTNEAEISPLDKIGLTDPLVMENQKDLTEILHTLKQVVCVKG